MSSADTLDVGCPVRSCLIAPDRDRPLQFRSSWPCTVVFPALVSCVKYEAGSEDLQVRSPVICKTAQNPQAPAMGTGFGRLRTCLLWLHYLPSLVLDAWTPSAAGRVTLQSVRASRFSVLRLEERCARIPGTVWWPDSVVLSSCVHSSHQGSPTSRSDAWWSEGGATQY